MLADTHRLTAALRSHEQALRVALLCVGDAAVAASVATWEKVTRAPDALMDELAATWLLADRR